jgi:hypothetical protein
MSNKRSGEASPIPTVGIDRLSVRRSNTEDNSDQDVLERGDQKQCRVFVIEGLQLLIVDIWLGIPGLTTDPEKDEDLNGEVDDGLTDDAGQDFLGHQTSRWPFRVDLGVW